MLKGFVAVPVLQSPTPKKLRFQSSLALSMNKLTQKESQEKFLPEIVESSSCQLNLHSLQQKIAARQKKSERKMSNNLHHQHINFLKKIPVDSYRGSPQVESNKDYIDLKDKLRLIFKRPELMHWRRRNALQEGASIKVLIEQTPQTKSSLIQGNNCRPKTQLYQQNEPRRSSALSSFEAKPAQQEQLQTNAGINLPLGRIGSNGCKQSKHTRTESTLKIKVEQLQKKNVKETTSESKLNQQLTLEPIVKTTGNKLLLPKHTKGIGKSVSFKYSPREGQSEAEPSSGSFSLPKSILKKTSLISFDCYKNERSQQIQTQELYKRKIPYLVFHQKLSKNSCYDLRCILPPKQQKKQIKGFERGSPIVN